MQSVRFTTRVAVNHARELLARDRARTQKFIAGIGAHGPMVHFEGRRRGHHHGGSSDPTGTTPTSSEPTGIDVTDSGVTYTAAVGVGNPPTSYTLLIDTGEVSKFSWLGALTKQFTGSSNTWVGADKKYVKTSSSKDTGGKVVSPLY